MIKAICMAFLMTLFAIAATVCIIGFAGAGGCAPAPHAVVTPHVVPPAPTPTPSPVFHPIQASAPTVRAIQKPLIIASVVTLLLAGAFFGLEFFAPLSFVGKIGFPIMTGVSTFAGFGAFAVPFFPYVLIAVAALTLAFGVYEFFHLKVRQRIESKVDAALPPVVGPTSTGV